jgi:branched-subunit amino acid aminotransferase/4-amino-4-deoxychorismate lyase
MEPQAYLNGQFIPARQAALSIVDAGFVMGATVTEQLRTFGGRLFRPERHFERLQHSLEVCGIEPGVGIDEIARIAEELVGRNHPLLAPGDDLGLVIFATPGPYAPLADLRPPTSDLRSPTLGLHTFPLAFSLWARAYREGISLVTTSIRQVPGQCWPPELKCRSRMHYFLADREAAAIEPGARALLLDIDEHVEETSTSNILVYLAGVGLVAPPRSTVLPGVSLEVVIELAAQLGIPYSEREIRSEEVATADEVMLSSTPNCLLPVGRFNGRSISPNKSWPAYRRLLTAWSSMVGLDIAAQAESFAK